MTYGEAVAHLYGLGPELAARAPAAAGATQVGQSATGPPNRFNLAHMRTLCAALGDPQNLVPAVLIAGTNGKGSTAATLASILAAAGYRTGLYTSPHLIRVNERIQMTGTAETGSGEPSTLHPISDDVYARLYTHVDDVCEGLVRDGALEQLPSFFERLTAVAFLYFSGRSAGTPAADLMVLEVGLGGRLDATNVVEPLLAVITDIALDHQDYLGDTIAQITREKCGILRPGGTLITLPQTAEANQTIGEVATELGVNAWNAAEYVPAPDRSGREGQGLQRSRYEVTIADAAEPGVVVVDSPLPGTHQQRNIALALTAAIALRNQNGYKITNHALEHGIRTTQWPGRLEWIAPNLLLDVAHNPAGAWTLRAAIAAFPPDQPRTLLFSCLRDKKLVEISRILFPLFDSSIDGPLERRRDRIVLAPIPNPRASSMDELEAAAKALGVPAITVPDLSSALAQAKAITPPGGIIIATGSVYLVGEIRRLALGIADPLAEVMR